MKGDFMDIDVAKTQLKFEQTRETVSFLEAIGFTSLSDNDYSYNGRLKKDEYT